MSNLIEKSLLIGFGVFTLIIFFSVIQPFINIFIVNYQNEKTVLDSFNQCIDKIDTGVYYIIANPSDEYYVNIDLPTDLNISVFKNEIHYDYRINTDIVSTRKNYPNNFVHITYIEYPPRIYNLRVFFDSDLIRIQID